MTISHKRLIKKHEEQRFASREVPWKIIHGKQIEYWEGKSLREKDHESLKDFVTILSEWRMKHDPGIFPWSSLNLRGWWNLNDPCFDWKGSCFGGFLPCKNRGQLGSRYLYLVPKTSTNYNDWLISWISPNYYINKKRWVFHHFHPLRKWSFRVLGIEITSLPIWLYISLTILAIHPSSRSQGRSQAFHSRSGERHEGETKLVLVERLRKEETNPEKWSRAIKKEVSTKTPKSKCSSFGMGKNQTLSKKVKWKIQSI